MIKHVVTKAGKIPGMYDDIGLYNLGLTEPLGILMKSRFDSEWLDNSIEDGTTADV